MIKKKMHRMTSSGPLCLICANLVFASSQDANRPKVHDKDKHKCQNTIEEMREWMKIGKIIQKKLLRTKIEMN